MKSQTEIIRAVNPFYQRVGKEYLARRKEEKENPVVAPTPIVSPQENKSVQTKDDYIYFPTLGFYVAKERSYLGKNWYVCQKLLCDENAKMLNLNEMREFLKSAKEYHPDIYNDILEVKAPSKSEWIDADFKTTGSKLYLNSNHTLDSNGNLITDISQPLAGDTLKKDKTPGICLEDWITNPTKQGLPKNSKGDLYYWAPDLDNNSVAGLSADSGRADLSCDWYPSGRNSGLGVRAVKRRE